MNDRRSRALGPRGRPRGALDSFARLDVSVAEHPGYAVVTVTGEIDVTTGSGLRDVLHELAQRDVVHHIVDLRAVTFLDSTGLGILVGHQKRLTDHHGSLQAVCGPGLVGRVFRLTGVDMLIPVRASVEAAAAILAHVGPA